jgi:hypothetical protein
MILATAYACAGCGHASTRESSHPLDLSTGVVETIVKRFYRQDIKLSNFTYEAPITSSGGHAPAGVELFPVKAHVIGSGEADKEIQFYFFRAPYGWDGYPK